MRKVKSLDSLECATEIGCFYQEFLKLYMLWKIYSLAKKCMLSSFQSFHVQNDFDGYKKERMTRTN